MYVSYNILVYKICRACIDFFLNNVLYNDTITILYMIKMKVLRKGNDKLLIIIGYILNVEEVIVEKLYLCLASVLYELKNAFISPQTHTAVIL